MNIQNQISNFTKFLSIAVLSSSVFTYGCSKFGGESLLNQCKLTYKEKNYQEAFDLCKKSADKNNAEAQVLLGLMYYNGEGVERDRFESYRLYKKAAEQGYAEAQYRLGKIIYEDNQYEGFKWYKKAAEQGNVEAQYELSELYAEDNSLSVLDYKEKHGSIEGLTWKKAKEISQQETLKWCKRAAELGYAKAQVRLADMYFKGNCVERNQQSAFNWLQKAAKQGDLDALRTLGYTYENITLDSSFDNSTFSTNQKLHEAIKWYKKAAECEFQRSLN